MRYYDPTIGRWISRDPLGFDAGDGNLYRYIKNQSQTQTDPSGLSMFALGNSALDDVVAKAKKAGISVVPVNIGKVNWPERMPLG